MMRKTILIILIGLLFVVTLTSNAAELEAFSQSMEYDLRRNSANIDDIHMEILEQAQAVAEINKMDDGIERETIDMAKAVKVAWIHTGSKSEIMEQLGTARDVVMRRYHVSTEDMFHDDFLDYYWKVPVIQTSQGSILADVILRDKGENEISTTYIPQTEEDWNQYLYDENIVLDILTDSGLQIKRETVLPVSIPTMGLENGKVYSYDEIEKAVEYLIEDMTAQGSGAYSGGGSGQADTGKNMKPEVIVTLLICLLIAGACIAVVARSGQNRKDRVN